MQRFIILLLQLNIDENYAVYVDGKPCSNLVERDEILKAADPDAVSIQYDDLKKYKKDELRDFFVGKSVALGSTYCKIEL